MTQKPIDILGLTCRLCVRLAAARGVPRPEAIAAYRRAFRTGRPDVDWISLPQVTIGESLAEGNTMKLGLTLGDGRETECVVLPQSSRTGRPRNTLCLSAQIGCARGCVFCQTARMGLVRSLTAAEIVAQWHTARFSLGTDISNIVFMGMGEPLDNLDEVIQAIRIFADHDGPAIPASRISVSTVGLPRSIARLATLAKEPGLRRLGLAVSLNAPNDEVRSRLMPVNRIAPMAVLREAMLAWPVGNRGRILIEYVLIPGVNDAPEHAKQLGDYLRPLKCTLNVIPYNPTGDLPWPSPRPEQVGRFIDRVIDYGILVKRRRTIGRSISGACGQLAGRRVGSGVR
ncbi:MAG: 23S rRNA (adenine(2503)-C(2))-methyltransferase RlmN [Phycisphaerales bacterium]|nr:MAG: 23S rRNA (adenine(2503)-C(2))-methyltransferase RlmN [Phycisphaerales bacterium]